MTNTTNPTVWVWDWNRDTDELEMARLPREAVPAQWLEALQRRYEKGERVRFCFEEGAAAEFGTVAKDQGIYVAIDRDDRGGATIHKSNIEPADQEDTQSQAQVGEETPVAPVSPHADPDLRTTPRVIEARWNIGAPDEEGWQRQAVLNVSHAKGSGFRVTVRNIAEQRDRYFRTEKFDMTAPATALHFHPATRFSAKRLRESYQEGLAELRAHFDAADPKVLRYFLPSSAE